MPDFYQCYRCGMEFGSQAGVRLHLRKKHDGIRICDKCGKEIKVLKETVQNLNKVPGVKLSLIITLYIYNFKSHLLTYHGSELIPRSSEESKQKSLLVARKDTWEKTGERLTYFSEPKTYQTCRMCRIILSSTHEREEHERRRHKLTEYVRGEG